MQKKTIKMSLVLTMLLLSLFFSIAVVTFVQAKKPAYTSGPVYINDGIQDCTWKVWSAQPWLKGSGTEEDPYLIKDLTIDVSGEDFALMIENSNVHFKIMKCTFRNGAIENERTAAVILAGTQNGVIFKNTFFGSNGGLALIGTQNILVHKNIFTENQAGIFLQWAMFNTLKQNELKNNFGPGIMLSTAHKTIIEKNKISGNGLAGILLINEQDNDPEGEHDPKDNIIYKNTIENNPYGVLFTRADINDVIYNTFSGNDYGMVLDIDCQGNSIYHNNFLDNGMQAFDAQPGMNNFYHPYMLEGNFWQGYSGVDEDKDGIGDMPYGYDAFPFMKKNGWEFYSPEEEEILNAFFNNINRLGGDRVVDGSETSYVIFGVIQVFSERINGEAYPPYSLHINGMNVLDSIWYYDSVWYFDEEGVLYGQPGLMQLFYLKLPPNYLYDEIGLSPGYHVFLVEFTCYNSGVQQYFSVYTGFTLI